MDLNEFYPPDIKRKYSGNPFQETVRMVCDLANIQIPNANLKKSRSVMDVVHRMVIESLKYSEAPPAEPSTRFEAAWHWWQTKVRPAQ